MLRVSPAVPHFLPGRLNIDRRQGGGRQRPSLRVTGQRQARPAAQGQLGAAPFPQGQCPRQLRAVSVGQQVRAGPGSWLGSRPASCVGSLSRSCRQRESGGRQHQGCDPGKALCSLHLPPSRRSQGVKDHLTLFLCSCLSREPALEWQECSMALSPILLPGFWGAQSI